MKIVTSLCVVAVSVAAWTQLARAQHVSTQPAPAVTTRPATGPATRPVAAMVGQKVIYLDQVEPGRKMPNDRSLVNYRRDRLRSLVMYELATQYLKDHKVDVAPEELAGEKAGMAKSMQIPSDQVGKWMEQTGMTDSGLADQIRRRKLQAAPSRQEIDAFIQANPECFDGASVHAAHIVIQCWPMASTAQQLQVRARLQQLADDIRAGKITFADAAARYSTDGTASKGGDLGEVTFEGRMVPTISMPLLKAKAGDMVIARSEYGYHLLKVIDRKQAAPTTQAATQPAATEPAATQPGESTSQPAQPDLKAQYVSRAIVYLTQMDILAQVLDKCPIQLAHPENYEYASPSTQPATAPATSPVAAATRPGLSPR